MIMRVDARKITVDFISVDVATTVSTVDMPGRYHHAVLRLDRRMLGQDNVPLERRLPLDGTMELRFTRAQLEQLIDEARRQLAEQPAP